VNVLVAGPQNGANNDSVMQVDVTVQISTFFVGRRRSWSLAAVALRAPREVVVATVPIKEHDDSSSHQAMTHEPSTLVNDDNKYVKNNRTQSGTSSVLKDVLRVKLS